MLETLAPVAFALPQADAIARVISDGLLDRFVAVIDNLGLTAEATAGGIAPHVGAVAAAPAAEVAVGVGVGVEVAVGVSAAAAGEVEVGVTVGVAVTTGIGSKDKRPRDDDEDAGRAAAPASKDRQETAVSSGKRAKLTTDELAADPPSVSTVHRIEDTASDDEAEGAEVGGAHHLPPASAGAPNGDGDGPGSATDVPPSMNGERLAMELNWCILWAITIGGHAATNTSLQANPRTAAVMAKLEALMGTLEGGVGDENTSARGGAAGVLTSWQLDQLRGILTMMLA